MPFNGSGGFVSVGAPNFPAVDGTTILASQYNTQLNDIFNGLSNAVTRDGQSPATANLPMGGFKFTNMGDGSANGQALVYGQAAAALLNGALTVTGAATFNGALTVTGAAAFNGGIAGQALFAAGSVGAPSLSFTGDTDSGFYSIGANRVGVATAGTRRVEWDASGNMGLGYTPNAWRTGANAFQSGVFLSLWQQTNGASNIGFGVFEDGVNTFKYTTTGDPVSVYSQISGRHIWYGAAAGTVNTAATLASRMELNPTSDLLVGNRITAGAGAPLLAGALVLGHAAANQNAAFGSFGGTTPKVFGCTDAGALAGLVLAGTVLQFSVDDATAAMRLDSTGLGLGRNATYKLDVAGGLRVGITGAGSGGSIRYMRDSGTDGWVTGILASVGATAWSVFDLVSGVERLRIDAGTGAAINIDSSGNLGLGVTPSGYNFDLGTSGKSIGGVSNISGYSNSGTYTISAGRTVANGGYIQLYGGSNATPDLLIFGTAGAERGRFNASGQFLLNAIHNNGAGASGTTPMIASGTYTPTLTGVTNVASTSGPVGVWSRTGSIVTVSVAFNVTPTAGANTTTQVRVTLPIPSNLTAATDTMGAVNELGSITSSMGITADTINDAAVVVFTAANTAGHSLSATFQYEVK